MGRKQRYGKMSGKAGGAIGGEAGAADTNVADDADGTDAMTNAAYKEAAASMTDDDDAPRYAVNVGRSAADDADDADAAAAAAYEDELASVSDDVVTDRGAYDASAGDAYEDAADRAASGRGMSAAFAKDTLRCWLRGWKRFVSIAVISLLGVAVLTGIYAGCRDMFLAADRFYDAQGLHDIQVLSTLGLTDDDVAALKSIEGVATVQPERSQSVETEVDGTAKTVTLAEIGTAELDQPYLQEGRMPTAAGEVAVTKKFLMDSGLKIGDTLTVTLADNADNTADATDEQSPRFPTKLTIVGEVLDPKDVSNPDGIGSKAFRQTIASDYTFFAPSAGVTGDVYTAISITVAGAVDESSFGGRYDDMVRAVAERIEHKVQTSRQQARRQQLVDAAQAKLDAAKTKADKQFDDAQTKLDKSSADLLKGRNELETNRGKLDENEAKIKDGERQIKDAREQIAKAKQQIDDGREQLKTARAQLDAGNAQLKSARSQLTAAQNALADKRKPIDDGIAQAKQGIAAIDGTLDAIGKAKNALAALPSAGDAASGRSARSGASGASDTAAGSTVNANNSNVSAANAQSRGESRANDQWTNVRKQLAALGISAPQLQPDQAAISALAGQLDARRSGLAAQREQLAQQRDQLTATLNNTIAPAQAQLDQQHTQLVSQELKAADSNVKLNQQGKQLDENAAKLDEQSKELDKRETELKDGRKKLEAGRKQLKTAEAKLADGEKQLTAAQKKLDQNKQQASDEFDRQQQRVDDIAEARWYVQTRSAIGGFSAIKSDLSSIESIGRAFPVVFLLVAVLMSLTTMTRMVEEERGLIGTYVGLGYGPAAIGARYVLFAALACLIGGGLGLIAGFIGIPAFLLVVLQGLYTVPGVRFEYDWLTGSAGIALFVVGVVAATVIAVAGELRRTPAELMRPKAPRAGSRVLLEHIGPLWRRMKFLNKVTVRNLVRFKSRLIMTVGGVAGCTALIVCGLAISDTVDALPVTQYRDVYRYDLMVVTDHDHVATMLERLRDDGAIGDADAAGDSAGSAGSDGSVGSSGTSDSFALARVENGEITTSMDETETVQIVTVPAGSAMRRIADLRSVADGQLIDTGKFEHGRADGVIVAQSAANALGVRTGDKITLKNGAAQRKQVRVVAVSRSVIGSDVYVLTGDYERFFGGTADGGDASADPEATVVDGVQMNTIFARYRGSDDDQIAYAERLGKDANVLSVASTADLRRSFSFDLMGAVVALIVALAGGLALVVLFTLANTNVSERVREMATLKVLGFFDREVHRYVNREMMILTVLGVIVGLPVGRWVGGLLTAALAMPGIYFEVTVRWQSYAIAAAVTLVFALLVQVFTNPVLDRIDPAVSLKSVE